MVARGVQRKLWAEAAEPALRGGAGGVSVPLHGLLLMLCWHHELFHVFGKIAKIFPIKQTKTYVGIEHM